MITSEDSIGSHCNLHVRRGNPGNGQLTQTILAVEPPLILGDGCWRPDGLVDIPGGGVDGLPMSKPLF